jgi:hypothetical protein
MGRPDDEHVCFEMDGARVHGDPGMSPESREALRQVIAAARRRFDTEHGGGRVDSEPMVWRRVDQADLVQRTGQVHVRLPYRQAGGGQIEGEVIKLSAMMLNGQPSGTRVALRTALHGRTEVLLAPHDQVEVLVPRLELDDGSQGPAGLERVQLNLQEAQLAEVDAVIARLEELWLLGENAAPGYQSPAVRQVIDALTELRRGRPDVCMMLGR